MAITAIKNIIGLIDLTSLKAADSASSITALCQQAQTPLGPVAAVCIYGPFVALAKKLLHQTPIKIATVSNFPGGDQSIQKTLTEITQLREDGADEIDVVMPYMQYKQGQRQFVQDYMQQCKAQCGNSLLKVILETGSLEDPSIIADASQDMIELGADFIKTSTGKINKNATPEAVRVMLETIKRCNPDVGCKVAGGVRDLATAEAYLALVNEIMGVKWVNRSHFRFGASGLLDQLLATAESS